MEPLPSEPAENLSVWSSLHEYSTSLGHWGWFVFIGVLGELIGLFSSLSGGTAVPALVWVTALVLTTLTVPFFAFHSLRVRMHRNASASELEKTNAQSDLAAEVVRSRERLDSDERRHKQELAESGRQLIATQSEYSRLKEQFAKLEKAYDERATKRELLLQLETHLSSVVGIIAKQVMPQSLIETRELEQEANKWIAAVNAILDSDCFRGANGIFNDINRLEFEEAQHAVIGIAQPNNADFVKIGLQVRRAALRRIIQDHYAT